MNCSACGTGLPPQAKFCGECGARSLVAGGPPAADPADARPEPPDRVRSWCIALAIALVAALFVPVIVGTFRLRVGMFWDLFDDAPKRAAWQLVNAILGLTVFVLTLVFARGVVRGAVMLGAGLLGFILTLALLATPSFAEVMGLLGSLAIAVTLGALVLRQRNQLESFARITAAVAGGLVVVFVLASVIAMLVDTSDHWTSIVGNIVVACYRLTPVIAGVLCLVLLRSLPTTPRLVRGATTLVYVYLCCRLGWSVIFPIITGLSAKHDGDVVFVSSVQTLALQACSVAHLLLLGWGTAELAYGTWKAGRQVPTEPPVLVAT